MIKRWGLLIVALLFSSAALASTTNMGLFTPPATDRSIYYLKLIFGSVATVLDATGVGNQLMGQMFRAFNTSIFIVGVVFIALTGFTSIIRMSAEGQILGRQVSNLWVPVRAAIGLLILTPTSSGYCFIQALAMWVVINGIGAADAVWEVLLEHSFSQSRVEMIPMLDAPLTKHLLIMAACQEMFNVGRVSDGSSNLDIEPWASGADTVIFQQSSNDTYNAIMSPIQADKRALGMCGQITMPYYDKPPMSTSQSAINSAQSLLYSTYRTAVKNMQGPAYELLYMPQSTWTGQSVLHDARSIMFDSIINGMTRKKLGLPEAYNAGELQKSALADGWIHAGSFYFTLTMATQSESGSFMAVPTIVDIDGDSFKSAISDSASDAAKALDEFNKKVDAYWDSYQEYRQTLPEVRAVEGKLNMAGSSGGGGAFSPFPDVTPLTMKVVNAIAHNDPDPIYSLSKVGITIIQIIELMWFIALITIIGLVIVGAIMNCTTGGGDAVIGVIQAITVLMNIIMTLFWGAAVLIGIYLPLIPYLVYLLAAIGWFMLVIEAMTAMPLVALGFLAPNQEEFGKAGHGMMLLMNVALRPMLMVIGFAAASELVRVMARLVAYGFQSTLTATVGSTGVFAAIGILGLYIGMMISIVSECYTLIYVLPDRVMRWIGMSPEQSTVERALKQIKGKSDEAAQKTKEAGSGLAQGVSKGAKDMLGGQDDEGGDSEGGEGGK